MRSEDPRVGRRAATTVVLTTGRRAARSGALWGLLFGGLVWNEALSYHRNFPTLASRRSFAETFGSNAGLAAVVGPGHHLDTIEGFVAWRMFGLMIIVGAIWGLLAATRLLRGEEDAGRWELLLAGRTSRRLAGVQAVVGLAMGFLILWGITAVLTVAAGRRSDVGFSVPASLFYATASTASAAMFLAIGALASQLGQTRRQASSLGAAVLGLAYLLRMLADSVSGLGWLRWASPLGWVENLRPLTGARPLALVPIGLLITAAASGAVLLAGWRDVGAGVLPRRESTRQSTRFLSPATVGARLERWVIAGWATGLGLLALVFGVVARTAGQAEVGVTAIQEAVGRLGGSSSGALTWIGYEFIFVAALVAYASAGQISTLRAEEADGRLDNLLARRVSRAAWLAGRLGLGVALVVLTSVATGIGGWLGSAGPASDIGPGAMARASVNVAVPGLFILGLGTLLFGIAPRLAGPITYAVVLWSFAIEILGSSITTNHWLLDTSVLSHLGPVPATGLAWAAIAYLTFAGAVAAAAGTLAFARRDLVAA